MKAQAATIEAIMASVFLISSAGLYSYAAYYASQEGPSQVNFINAFYDIMEYQYNNSTLTSCILDSGQGCAGSLLSNALSVYRLAYVSVSVDGKTAYAGNPSACAEVQRSCFVSDDAEHYVECVSGCV
ncbi:hypothetical protein M1452_01645 [Candidatus Marsarchaeota archaeon]|nr:hypothetical protein [Candidatus Marsarchaeota archaeon]